MTQALAMHIQPEADRALHFLSQTFSSRPPRRGLPVATEARPTVHLVGFGQMATDRISSLLRSEQMSVEHHVDIVGVAMRGRSDAPSCLIIGEEALAVSARAESAVDDAGSLPPLIVIADGIDVRAASWAVQAGVVDLLADHWGDDEVLEVVDKALDIDRRRCRDARTLRDLTGRFATLTRREIEVMMLVAQGLLNKQVGGELDISEITVKAHRGNAMRKMGARTFAELIRMADILAPVQTSPANAQPVESQLPDRPSD